MAIIVKSLEENMLRGAMLLPSALYRVLVLVHSEGVELRPLRRIGTPAKVVRVYGNSGVHPLFKRFKLLWLCLCSIIITGTYREFRIACCRGAPRRFLHQGIR